ncbi:MAG: YheC/YheD family protein [Bacillaceae bacterium]|nr:YheC/YheD family protein [Bacillaceae bacterium]
MPGVEAIKKVFDLQERDAFKKEQEMIQACTVICEQLSNCCGNYGDVGVDVILDENQKVWVLEVNKLHDHKFPLYALEDEQMYYKVITTPFEYASYLAGF